HRQRAALHRRRRVGSMLGRPASARRVAPSGCRSPRPPRVGAGTRGPERGNGATVRAVAKVGAERTRVVAGVAVALLVPVAVALIVEHDTPRTNVPGGL